MRFSDAVIAVLGIVSVIAPFAHCDEPLPTAEAYALVGGRVYLEPGQVLDKATILVRGGRIEQVGIDLAIPSDALRVDLTGLVVHAGFLDAGTTSGYDSKLRPQSVREESNVDVTAKAYAATPAADRHLVTPEFQVARALVVDSDDWEKWRLAGFTDRVVKPAGGILAGQSALVSLRGLPLLDSVLRDRVALQIALEPDGKDYPVTLMGSIARVRQTLADAEHFRHLESFAAQKGSASFMPPADPALHELKPVLDGVLPVCLKAQTEDEIYRALALAEEWKVALRIDGGREAWKLADRLAKRPTAVLLSADFPERPKKLGLDDKGKEDDRGIDVDDMEAQSLERPKRVVDDELRLWKEDLQGVRQLLDAELPVGLAFDGVPADKVADRIDLLVKEGGLNPDDILKLLTTQAAQAIGVADQLGAIAPGMRAHLVARSSLWTDKDSIVRMVLIEDRLFEYREVARRQKADKNDKRDETKEAANQQNKPASESEDPAAIATELDFDRTPKRRTGGNILLRGAHVLSIGPLGDLSNADVLVRQGKIAQVGPNLQADANSVIVDAQGWFLMPGIIDSHSHMAISGGVNEYSRSITPEVRIRDVIDSKDVALYRALAGGVTTARLLHGSANTIGGQDAVIKLRYGKPAPELLITDAPLGVKFALGENVTRNRSRFPNTRLGVEAVLVRAFSEADAYRRIWDEYRKRSSTGSHPEPPPRRDFRLEALARVLDDEIGVHCHCYRADEILMLLGVADRYQIRLRSLQHALEAYKIAPEVAAHGCSVSTFSDWWAYKWEAYDATPYNTAILREAGVPTCLKSDSPNVVRTMNQEAAKLLRYGGLSPTEALQTITILPARQLRLDGRIGSIEIGKDADLALFNGHPLNTFARCEMTLIDGEIYFERRGKDAIPNDPPAGEPSPAIASPAVKPRPSGNDAVSGGQPAPPDLKVMSLNLDLPTTTRRDGEFSIRESSQGRYLIVDADIYPVSGDVVRSGALLIEGGKITAVLPTSKDLGVQEPIQVVHAKGLRVYPGFIDAGCKVGLAEVDSSRETLDFDETGVFQPDLRAAAAIHPDSALIPVTRAGGVTTVVSMPTGGVVSGQSALVQLAGWVPSEMVLVDPLALHMRFPKPPEKPSNDKTLYDGRGRFADLRDRRIQEFRSLVRLGRHYDQSIHDAQARKSTLPVVDPRLEALLPFLRKEKPVAIHAETVTDILQAIRLANELDLRLIVQGARDAWKVVDKLKEHEIPVIVGPILTLPSANHDPYDAPFANLARLHEAGVRFCIQTDDTSNSRNLPLHAAIAVAYGLPPVEGLKAITLYPAQILGVADQLGSIEPGKIANLILCDGDPLQLSTRIHSLFIAGKPMAPTSQHTELAERYRQRLTGSGQGGEEQRE